MIDKLSANWRRIAAEFAQMPSSIPNVNAGEGSSYSFSLGTHEVLRLTQRTSYIYVSFEVWGPGQPQLQSNQFHGTMLEAIEYVGPIVIQNLTEFKETAKNLGII